jgi:hypothetical protein
MIIPEAMNHPDSPQLTLANEVSSQSRAIKLSLLNRWPVQALAGG